MAKSFAYHKGDESNMSQYTPRLLKNKQMEYRRNLNEEIKPGTPSLPVDPTEDLPIPGGEPGKTLRRI